MCFKPSKRSLRTPLCTASRQRKPSREQYRRRRARTAIQGKEKERVVLKKAMEMKNLKLYMKNKSIIEENEKLRKQAYLLSQENQALLFQLQNFFSKSSAASQKPPCKTQ